MTATITPFPLVRRRAYISKQAEQMACMSDVSAARYLQHQLQVQREAMRRRGVADDLIERELKSMEGAIRREFETVTGAA
jgi:predicted GIY-YIG superfamily endonuclease